VDDDEEVHGVTRLVLEKIQFKGRRLELLDAYSAAEARRMFDEHDDIAIVLLDVVMESDDAGLRLVHDIRNDLGNTMVRIILRTGQAGRAPEERMIVDYDINDYKTKSELTAQKLFTTVIASLRSFETILTLEKTRQGLEKIIESSDTLFKPCRMRQFSSGVLMQLSAFLGCAPNGIVCFQRDQGLSPDAIADSRFQGLEIVAATGEYSDCLDCKQDHLCIHQTMFAHVLRAMEEKKHYFDDHYTVLYLEPEEDRSMVALLHGGGVADGSDARLLEVFVSKISIAFANAIHYQKMVTAEEAATTDFLTGLNNRRQLLRMGVPLLAGAVRAGTPLAVAMLDIDHFKEINDRHGHDGGDIVLQKIAALMKERFRASDIVARFGGEEFCVIAPQLAAVDATENTFSLFDGFRQALADLPIKIHSHDIRVTISIGVTTAVKEDIDEMIVAADHLLYAAKEGGRDRVILSGGAT
jgi:diguanylate cyclase (GGDEF)-like protein